MNPPTARPKTVWMLGHRVTLIPCGGSHYLLDITTPAGVPGPPPHYHEDASEMFYIVSGELEVRCGDQWLTLGEGETFDVPRGEIHTFKNPLDIEVRWLTGWNPLGFQEWFARYGVDASDPEAAVKSVSEENIRAAVAATADYGMVVVSES